MEVDGVPMGLGDPLHRSIRRILLEKVESPEEVDWALKQTDEVMELETVPYPRSDEGRRTEEVLELRAGGEAIEVVPPVGEGGSKLDESESIHDDDENVSCGFAHPRVCFPRRGGLYQGLRRLMHVRQIVSFTSDAK